MAFKLDEKTLEPANGDYIEFLKQIERGNARVQGLTVSVSDELPGVVMVRRTGEAAQEAPSSPGAVPVDSESIPKLLVFAGSIVAVLGVFCIGTGMQYHELQNLIPVGMFVTFGGLVLALHNRQKVDRIRRAKKTENTENPN